jgi:hypothetical protein
LEVDHGRGIVAHPDRSPSPPGRFVDPTCENVDNQSHASRSKAAL